MGKRIVNNNQRDADFADDDFLRDICLGKYVLLLGEDVILKPEYGGGDVTEYIRNECEKGLSESDRDKLYEVKVTMKDLVRRMLCEEWEYDIDEMSPSLVKLLETKCFPLVLTTGFDGYVETVMRKIYGKLSVKNFLENKGGIEKNKEYGSFTPTLYYVFGKAQEGNLDFAYNEDDHMRILCMWMDNDKPQRLIDYLRKKKILAIGGKYENWYFRFFWYCLRQSMNAGEREGDVAISLDSEKDNKLLDYLQDINVKNHEGQARDFLDDLSQKLCNPDEKLYEAIHLAHRQKMGVFISYAHEDYPIACQIYSSLVSLNAPVWFDTDKLKGGDEYKKRIQEAINECTIFMPILSQQTKEDCENNTWRFYKDEEWKMVLCNKACRIMPVALYGFDIRQDVHLIPFENVTIINWAKDGSTGLEKALNEHKTW